MKMYLNSVITLILTVLTVYFTSSLVGWEQLMNKLVSVPVDTLILIVILSILSYLLRAYRIAVSFPNTLALGFSRLFTLTATHNFFAVLLPMRTGEAAFPILMKKRYDIALFNSSAHLVLYRLFDLIILLAIGGLVIGFSINSWLATVVLACVIAFPWSFRLFQRVLVAGLRTRSHRYLLKLADSIDGLPTSNQQCLKIGVVTLFIWLTKVVAFVSLIRVSSDLSFVTSVVAMISAEIASVIPIQGFAGMGTYEGAFVLSGAVFHDNARVLLASAIQLHIFLIVMAFLMCAVGQLMALLHYFNARNKA